MTAFGKYHKRDRAQPENFLEPTLTPNNLLTTLHDDLARQYGSVLPSADLVRVLGYRTSGAFRQAMVRDTVPVPLFTIPHRRGHFALALDVATWMYRQRCDAKHLNKTDLNTRDNTQPSVTENNLAHSCTEA